MRRFLLGISVVLVSLGVVWRQVEAQTLLLDEYGDTFIEWQGQVLGERSDSSGSSGSGSSDGSNSGGGTSGSPTQVEPTPFRVEIRTRTSETDRTRTEIRTDSDGTTRFRQEVRDATGVREIRIRDGRLEIRIKPPEAEDENDLEQEDEEEATGGGQTVENVRVRERLDRHEVEIRAAGTRIEIRQRRVRARTNFPLTIGPNNELLVNTPAGLKEVAILPEQAVANLLANGVITSIASPSAGLGASGATGASGSVAKEEATEAAQQEQELPEVELGERSGILIYTVHGLKSMKLFGQVPITTPIQVTVSAETGAVIDVNQAWFMSLFGFLFRP